LLLKARLIEDGQLLPQDLIDPFSIKSERVRIEVENRPGRVADEDDVILDARFPLVNLEELDRDHLMGNTPLNIQVNQDFLAVHMNDN
jgi:hypothetical protein